MNATDRAGMEKGFCPGSSDDVQGDVGSWARVSKVHVGVVLLLALVTVAGACGIVRSSDYSDLEEYFDSHGKYTFCHSPGWAEPRQYRIGPRHRFDSGSVEWMPSGSELVFSMNSDIYAVPIDGTGLRTLAIAGLGGTSGSSTTAFSVAPDGSIMVYATCEFDDDSPGYYFHELALIDLSLSDASPQRLTSNEAFDYHPRWSPDGRSIAYLGGDHYAAYDEFRDHTLGGLHIVGHDGAGSRAVRGGEELVGPPRWSPDGRWLAFVNDDGDAGLGLYVVNADRTVRRRLSDAASEPSWSPDSRQLAVIRRDSERRALYTIAVTRNDAAEQWVADLPDSVARLDLPPPLRLVAWSPSGKYIAYECDAERLCIVTPGGTQIGESFYGQAAAWSPDGSRLAVVVGDPKRQELDLVWRDYVRRHLLPLVDDDRTVRVYTVAPDGSDMRPLVREFEDGSLVAAAAA